MFTSMESIFVATGAVNTKMWQLQLQSIKMVFVKSLVRTVHFYRNIFSTVPRSKVRLVAKMPKAIHAQESKKAAREKAAAIVAELQGMKLKEAAKKVSESIVPHRLCRPLHRGIQVRPHNRNRSIKKLLTTESNR